MSGRKLCRQIAFLVVANLFLLPIQLRAESETAALPPEAQSAFYSGFAAAKQQAFDKGLAAVEQQAWDLAIRYFTEALDWAKPDPRVLFNLGLTHGKAGHELPAVAWLHAYLAVVPRAPNADAVRQEIAKLLLAAEVKRDRVFEYAVKTARELPEEWDQREAFEKVATWLARGGDIRGALEAISAAYALQRKLAPQATSSLPGAEARPNLYMWEQYAELLREGGDLEGYAAAITNIKGEHEPSQDEFWRMFSTELANRGWAYGWPADYAMARQAAERIQDPALKEKQLKVASETEAKNKAEEGEYLAQNGLKIWLSLAQRLSDPDSVLVTVFVSRCVFVDLQKALRGAGTEVEVDFSSPDLPLKGRPALPVETIVNVSRVGVPLGEALVAIRSLEKRLAQ